MLIPPELIFKVYHTFIDKHIPTSSTCKLLKTGKEACEGCPVSIDKARCGLKPDHNKDHSASFEAFYDRYPEILI